MTDIAAPWAEEFTRLNCPPERAAELLTILHRDGVAAWRDALTPDERAAVERVLRRQAQPPDDDLTWSTGW